MKKKRPSYRSIIENCIEHKFNLKIENVKDMPRGFYNSGIEGDSEFSQLNKFVTNNTIFHHIYKETEAVCTMKGENISSIQKNKYNVDFLDAFNMHRHEIFDGVFKKCWDIILDFKKIDEETKHYAKAILSDCGIVKEVSLMEDLMGIDLYVIINDKQYSVQIKSSKDLIKDIDTIILGSTGDYTKIKEADYFIFFKRSYDDLKRKNEYTEACLMPTEKLSIIGNRIDYTDCRDRVKNFTQSQMEAYRIAYEKSEADKDYGKPLFD